MEVAEAVVPFGEWAENLRAEYVANVIAASQGSEKAAARANELMKILRSEA